MLESLLFLAQTTSSDDGAAGGAALLIQCCVFIVFVVPSLAAMWVLYDKAGKPGWAAIIPIYNLIVMLEIVGRPIWWIILLFIPFVNIIVNIILLMDFAKSYGKDQLYGCGIAILPFIFLPLMAFTGDTRYVGPAAAQ